MSKLYNQIICAEEMRCAAMLSGNITQLQNILDDRMTFCHATGRVDNKTAYLSKMAEGKIQYRSIEWNQQAVTDLHGSALLTGKMVTNVCVAGTEKTLINQVISVWADYSKLSAEQSNVQWKLLAFQSTPIAQ